MSQGNQAYIRPLGLIEVLAGVDCQMPDEESNRVVHSITADSRTCNEQSLFFALSGEISDGHDFAAQAYAKGCRVMVVEKSGLEKVVKAIPSKDLVVVVVEDSREAYGKSAANCYGNPSVGMILVGITGTNGKTTITYLLEELLLAQGKAVGVIGTVDYRWTGKDGVKGNLAASRTTPDGLELQYILSKMAKAGVEYVVMEVSSHALVQRRIVGLTFAISVFTNLSHDHLDYHGDMDDYFTAKTKLFTNYTREDGVAVMLSDHQGEGENKWVEQLQKVCNTCGLKTVVAGCATGVDIQLVGSKASLNGNRITIKYAQQELVIKTPLVGAFNVENLLLAVGVCKGLGLEPESLLPVLEVAKGAPGRLERVVCKKSRDLPVVFVDYAHTPDALEQVLLTLKKVPHGDLFCVFGCGGDRDNTKRPIMGEIAASIATVAIITDDNPRTETPETILEQVLAGALKTEITQRKQDWIQQRKSGEGGCLVIGNRSEAIRAGVCGAKEGDIVLIAGKGHEKYQLTPKGQRFFDDCLEAKEAMLSWTNLRLSSTLSSPIHGRVQKWPSGKIAIDSRAAGKGDVFVAISGENFDGHDYVKQSLENGCSLAVVSEESSFEEMVPRIRVADTLKALGDLAAYKRRIIKEETGLLTVGITGSCGKTTVKEMVFSVFTKKWSECVTAPKNRVLKTEGNFNNLIGVPLSLFPLQVKHKAAIIEMGMNRKGEIKRLSEIVAADICCITNVHAAHLEELKTIENVAKAKLELFDEAGRDSVLVVNGDDALLLKASENYSQKKVVFGLNSSANDVYAENVSLDADGCATFDLLIGQEIMRISLPVTGKHNVINSLAAAAVCHAAGFDVETIAVGLRDFSQVGKRMELLKLGSTIKILNDTYNANPASMKAALQTLVSMEGDVKIAVLGDMLELGGDSKRAHTEIGCFSAQTKIDCILLYGDKMLHAKAGVEEAGGEAHHFKDKQELALFLSDYLKKQHTGQNKCFLFKGSRGMKMESVIEQLQGEL